MTDSEIMQLAKEAGLDLDPTQNMLITVRGQHAQLVNFARAIIASHEEKMRAECEPVAAQSRFDGEEGWGFCSIEHHNLVRASKKSWPGYHTRLLYTHPQQDTRDAERYRWLCSHSICPSPSLWDRGVGFAAFEIARTGRSAFIGKEELDAAIDTVIAQQNAGREGE